MEQRPRLRALLLVPLPCEEEGDRGITVTRVLLSIICNSSTPRIELSSICSIKCGICVVHIKSISLYCDRIYWAIDYEVTISIKHRLYTIELRTECKVLIFIGLSISLDIK